MFRLLEKFREVERFFRYFSHSFRDFEDEMF